MAKPIYTSISNVVIQRACSPLGQTVLIYQYETSLYRGRALLYGEAYLHINIKRSYIEGVLLQGRQYLHINIKRSYIEDVLSFRADSIYTSISNVVIQRTYSPLGQAVFCINIKLNYIRGRALLQGRQYLHINIKRSYIEDVLSIRADSTDISI